MEVMRRQRFVEAIAKMLRISQSDCLPVQMDSASVLNTNVMELTTVMMEVTKEWKPVSRTVLGDIGIVQGVSASRKGKNAKYIKPLLIGMTA